MVGVVGGFTSVVGVVGGVSSVVGVVGGFPSVVGVVGFFPSMVVFPSVTFVIFPVDVPVVFSDVPLVDMFRVTFWDEVTTPLPAATPGCETGFFLEFAGSDDGGGGGGDDGGGKGMMMG